MPVISESKVTEKMAELQAAFKQELPGRIMDIDRVWGAFCQEEMSDSNLHELHRMVHSLAGTGACFGATDISAVAWELEQSLKFLLNEPDKSQSFSSAKQQQINEVFVRLKQAVEKKLLADLSYIQPCELEIKRDVNLVYLLMDDKSLVADLLAGIEQTNYRVRHFTKLSDFESACEKELPLVVIMDVVIRDDNTLAESINIQLKEKLKASSKMIFISSRDDFEARLATARAGACRYFIKPVNKVKLISTIEDLTSQLVISPYRVLLIDDDETLLAFYATVLRDAGMIVETLSDPLQGLKVLAEFKPDIIVMDVYMPKCSGLELAQIIRQDDAWDMMPIMFLSVESDLSHQLLAISLGSKDFLVKPVEASHLVAAVVARVKQAQMRSQLNNKLKEVLRENKFQLVTMDQHAIVSVADVAGRITSVNDRFCEVSGYSRDELIGQNHRLLKSGLHPVSFYEEIWQTISNGKVWRGTICNRKKNGDEYWVESTIIPFLDNRGKPYKYVSARTDVTQLRTSEERLIRSQEFARIGTWDWNIKTGDLYWSNRIWPLFGYQKEVTETTYDNFLAAVHPDDRQGVIDAVNNCVEHNAEYDIEHRVVWPDGSVHWVSESGNVVRGESGEALHMLGVVQDINARKHSELALAKSKRQLIEAQTMASIGNWRADLISGEVSWSDEIYRIFGHQPGSFTPSVEAFNAAVHPDDLVRVKSSEDQAKKTGRHDVVHRIIMPDGSVRHVHALAEAETDDYGNLSTMTGTMQDITYQVAAEQELIDAREEAENANRAKSQFLSSMSHELRTPMNAIMGFSQLLKLETDQPLSESQAENVEEITKASEHLLKLINEVLDLAKIEAGRVDLSIEAVELGEVIGESLQLINPLAQKRGIEISLTRDGAEITVSQLMQQSYAVRADSTRLRQVLLNLLSNAVKYNRENGKINIACDATISESHTRISITDTGKGLTQQQQSQLFKAFNRLGVEESNIEGTGIGLVITRNIVELMGGNIDVDSKPEQGSTFWIELPSDTLHGEKNIMPDEKDTTPLQATSSETYEHTVLYIEDNPANLRLVTQLLGLRSNIHMWSAHEPLLGLELAAEHKPDLILLDINLPGMDGFEVLKNLRKHEATLNTPVIAISANAMPRDIEKGMGAGFNDYITKPVDVKKLLQAVENVLQEHG